MNANEVIGKYLLAKRNCPTYDRPGGNKIGELQKGLVYGPVYSYVEKDGKVFWMFDYSIPGQTPGAWYVEHKPGAFTPQGPGEDSTYFGGILSEAIVKPKSALMKYGLWLVFLVAIPYVFKKAKR